jgi:hypothetical protein
MKRFTSGLHRARASTLLILFAAVACDVGDTSSVETQTTTAAVTSGASIHYRLTRVYNGVNVSSISEARGLEKTTVTINESRLDGTVVQRTLPDNLKTNSVTFIANSGALSDWMRRAGLQGGQGFTANLDLLDFQNTPVRTYRLTNAVITNLQVQSLNSGASILVDAMTMSYDSLSIL